MSVQAVREKIAGTCRAHGWRLVSMRKRRDGLYLLVLRWDPMYFKTQAYKQVEFIAPLDRAYATVYNYLVDSNVVFMRRSS